MRKKQERKAKAEDECRKTSAAVVAWLRIRRISVVLRAHVVAKQRSEQAKQQIKKSLKFPLALNSQIRIILSCARTWLSW